MSSLPFVAAKHALITAKSGLSSSVTAKHAASTIAAYLGLVLGHCVEDERIEPSFGADGGGSVGVIELHEAPGLGEGRAALRQEGGSGLRCRLPVFGGLAKRSLVGAIVVELRCFLLIHQSHELYVALCLDGVIACTLTHGLKDRRGS